MGMTRQAKEDMVSSLTEKLEKAQSGIIAGFSGLDMESVSTVRQKFRDANVEYKVVKNTLMRRVLKGTPREGLADTFVGPCAIAFKYDEEAGVLGKTAKALTKEFEALEVKAGFFENDLLQGAGAVETLASLPTLDEARSKLLGVLTAPATKLAGVFQAPARDVIGVFKAKADKGE